MKTTIYCGGTQWCAKLKDGKIDTSNHLPQLMWMLFNEGYKPENIEME